MPDINELAEWALRNKESLKDKGFDIDDEIAKTFMAELEKVKHDEGLDTDVVQANLVEVLSAQINGEMDS